MAAPDYVPIFFKNRLHLAGRPPSRTRAIAALSSPQSARIKHAP
jgi:hypothetical protein